MKVTFRADASLLIGAGHVMRCLTLADALSSRGAKCSFISRAHDGNLIELIRSKGYCTHVLPLFPEASQKLSAPSIDESPSLLAHSHWLSSTQSQDAEACVSVLAEHRPNWLIVDHYALDACWEKVLSPHCQKLMVIDDLADRPHICDLLLDQTFGRDASDYRSLVPDDCHVLCGSQYALLRPEFTKLRHYSLKRREQPTLKELLITMGGVDRDNATGQVLQALRSCPLPANCRITVVMGSTAPWLEDVRAQAQFMPWQTRVLVGVSDMAQLMADSDLAIGAAGATSWERCCLGLPTIMFVLAENQIMVAQGLEHVGAAVQIRFGQSAATELQVRLKPFISDPHALFSMSKSAAEIVDGYGIETVILLIGVDNE